MPPSPMLGRSLLVSPQSLRGVFLHLLNRCKHVLIQPLMPDRPIVTLDVCVLLRLTRLDVLDGDATTFGPSQQMSADVFRAVVYPDCERWSPPFDDPIEAADDACRRQRGTVRNYVWRGHTVGFENLGRKHYNTIFKKRNMHSLQTGVQYGR
jgi:hypothetical protein